MHLNGLLAPWGTVQGVVTALIKRKIKYSWYRRKFRMEQLQRGRKGFIIYEERCKYLTIYEEAVSHIWLCNSSILKFLINEENFIFFFTGVFCLTTFITKKLRSETLLSGVRCAISVKRGSPGYGVLWSTDIHFNIRNLARERCDRDIFIHTPLFTFFFLSCLVQGICFIYQLSTCPLYCTCT